MQLKYKKTVVAAVFVVSAVCAAQAQQVTDQLRPLVEISAHRLMIAEQVALSKWDSGAAVEDPPREALVISDAVKKGEAKGLDQTFVSNFFKAQIEANKVVQYALLAEWHRSGNAPRHEPINLVATVRPQLDQIQISLITELANTAEIRSRATCHADVAKAVGAYFSAHKHDVGQLQPIELDRALAATCTQ